ncbi:MAG: hypothetical protein HY901_11915 [Deltaproteobacteria bacterium]|nr:hypothetical protein [Deltaproteobacteria bacterium]
MFGRMQEELEPIGFRRLGVHVERPPLKRGEVAYDFVHEAAQTWGTAYGRGEDVQLVLLTPFDGSSFVLTADHRLMSNDQPGKCLAGGMPGAQPEHLLAAHLRRVERLKEAGRTVSADLSLEARVRAANAWFAGWGARELRLRHVNGLLMTGMAVAIAGVMIWALVRNG